MSYRDHRTSQWAICCPECQYILTYFFPYTSKEQERRCLRCSANFDPMQQPTLPEPQGFLWCDHCQINTWGVDECSMCHPDEEFKRLNPEAGKASSYRLPPNRGRPAHKSHRRDRYSRSTRHTAASTGKSTGSTVNVSEWPSLGR